MKKICSFAFAIVLLFAAKTVTAQDSAAMMQAWMNFMTPGEHHKRLAKEVGTWDVEISSWMDPAQPPTKSKAKYVVSMTMNNLFQVGSLTGNIMGMPFTGQSLAGYDNAKKMYVLTWIDNLSSGMVNMTGSYNEKEKSMNFSGTQTDPLTGNNVNIREEIKYHSGDHYTMTMYGPGMDGKEMKMMEAVYKKKK